jgi:hypothetical protein
MMWNSYSFPFNSIFFYCDILARQFEVQDKSLKEEFEDTKGAIRIRISKKSRQHNDQKKKYKRTNNDQQNIHIKLNIE